MENWITEQLQGLNIGDNLISVISFIIIVLSIIVVGFIVNLIAKKLILNYVQKLSEKTATKIDDLFIKNKVFHNLAHLAPGATVYFMSSQLNTYGEFLQKLALTYMIFVVAVTSFKVLDSAVEVARIKSPSKGGPLKGIVQVVKIVIIVFCTLLVVVNFMGNSTAWAIFSGIGGMSAVLLLIFKDSILGLVAGLQLSSEKLLKLGDWLEMPKYNANGEVVDISLTKITVRNWDKTYTSIPAYKFIEDSFKNWEGMSEAGGRRIMRAINVDMTSVGFMTGEQIEDLMDVKVLKPYLEDKLKELTSVNETTGRMENINNRKLTNLGTFRAYINMYLKAHPKIRTDYTLLVRQLPPSSEGIPIELYCFTNDIAWANYESIQADIFDHLLSILPEFGLKVFQAPTGSDFNSAFTK